MLLKPKRTKFLKNQKGRIKYVYRPFKYTAKENKYAIVALEPGRITASHIYSTDLGIKRKLKQGGGNSKSIKRSLILKIFPHLPVTKKPIEVRMGKGKGKVEY
jgi:large subunit ribosomal protein L16